MHYTEYVPEIKRLLKLNEDEEAERLLLTCLDLTEQESNEKGYGVAPWYYERLAILYRKRKDYKKEVDILKRFDDQIKAPGVKPMRLKERLDKSKNKLAIYND